MLTAPLPGAKERNQTTGRETEIFPKLTASQLRVKEGNERERERGRDRYHYVRMPYSESCDNILILLVK
jgi:hypothetical protein